MNKIVHFTTVHPRFDGRIYQKECCSLAINNYDTHLVVADGLGSEMRDGVSIHDIGKSKFGRLGRFILKTSQMYFYARRLKGDLYHFHDPELIFTGVLLKLTGCKVIFDIHENLALQIMHKYWLPKPIRKITSVLYGSIENICCRLFDGLLVPQPTMKNSYSKLNKNTELVGNFVDVQNIEFNAKTGVSATDKFVLVHAGALSVERGVVNMLDLLAELDSSYQLYLAGNISNMALRTQLEQHNAWSKTLYYGVISSSEINKIYNESQVGLILYNNVGQYYLSYAIKLFEFMARGIPVIMPDFGEWPKFNERYNCGLCVDVNNPQGIALAVEYLKNNDEHRMFLGNNGMKAIENKFNWQLESEKLIAFYNRILVPTR